MAQVQLFCDECCKEFFVSVGNFNASKARKRYCSHECSTKGQTSRARICQNIDCGKEFVPKKGRNSKYCSRECMHIQLGKNQSKAQYLQPNDIFNKWTVIERLSIKEGQTYLCRCECGNEEKILGKDLIYEKTTGCIECIPDAPRLRRSYYEEISGQFINQAYVGAKRRGLEYTVTPKFIWNLFLEQDRRCNLTGEELSFTTKDRKNKASLDRIDSNIGYIPGNVQWVSALANLFKRDSVETEFIRDCYLVVNYQNSKQEYISDNEYF